ncbi:MAG: hypothetical protein WD648_12250 [Planctomycetaceae bacterium]
MLFQVIFAVPLLWIGARAFSREQIAGPVVGLLSPRSAKLFGMACVAVGVFFSVAAYLQIMMLTSGLGSS